MNTDEYVKLGIGAAVGMVIIMMCVIPMIISASENTVTNAYNDTQRYAATDVVADTTTIEFIGGSDYNITINGEPIKIGGGTPTPGYTTFRIFGDTFRLNNTNIEGIESLSLTDFRQRSDITLATGDTFRIENGTWTLTGSQNLSNTCTIAIMTNPEGTYGEFANGTQFNVNKANSIYIASWSGSVYMAEIDYTGAVRDTMYSYRLTENAYTPIDMPEVTTNYSNLNNLAVTMNTISTSNSTPFIFAPIEYLELDEGSASYQILMIVPILLIGIFIVGMVARFRD